MTSLSVFGLVPSDTPSDLEKLLASSKTFIGKVKKLNPSQIQPNSIDPHIEVREEAISRLSTTAHTVRQAFTNDLENLSKIKAKALALSSDVTSEADELLATDPFLGVDLDSVIPTLTPEEELDLPEFDTTIRVSDMDGFDSEYEIDEEPPIADEIENYHSDEDIDADATYEDAEAEEDENDGLEEDEALTADDAEEDEFSQDAVNALSFDSGDDEDEDLEEDQDEGLDEDEQDDLSEDEDVDLEEDEEDDYEIEETAEDEEILTTDIVEDELSPETIDPVIVQPENEAKIKEIEEDCDIANPLTVEADSRIPNEQSETKEDEVKLDPVLKTDSLDWRSKSGVSSASLVQFWNKAPTSKANVLQSAVIQQNTPRLNA